MKLILSCALALAFFHASAIADCSPEDIQGTYIGNIDGGGSESETFFEVDKNGSLGGSYVMSDYPDSPGKFSSLVLKSNKLLGNWEDIGGSGSFEFLFSDDCLSFSGFWMGTVRHSWDGSKI